MTVPTNPYPNLVNGATADADQIDAMFAPLYSVLNGGVDETNLAVPKGTFHAYRNASLSVATGATITFDTELSDVSNWYDTSTGRFTPQVAGYYRLSATVTGSVPQLAADNYWEPLIVKNAAILSYSLGICYQRGSAAGARVNGGIVVQANGTTDYFTVIVQHDASGSVPLQIGLYNSFFGHLIGRA